MASKSRNPTALIRKLYNGVTLWHPSTLKKPRVDPRFDRMPPITRAAESIKYNVLAFEYWLSPHGVLREFLKVSVLMMIMFFVIWLPLAFGAALLLHLVLQFQIIVADLFQIVLYAFLAMLLSLAVVILWHNKGIILALFGVGR